MKVSIGSALLLAMLAIGGSASANEPDLERGVFSEINLLRSDPPAYAAKLRAYRAQIGADGIWRAPGHPVGIITKEGTAAVDEAIAVLETNAPLPPLAADPQLTAAAQSHAAEQGKTGAIGHVSADGSTLSDRVSRGQKFYGQLAETISYGHNTPVDVVLQLLIDDGVPSRGHRNILLMPSLNYIGVGCGTHQKYKYTCVQDYSSKPVETTKMFQKISKYTISDKRFYKKFSRSACDYFL